MRTRRDRVGIVALSPALVPMVLVLVAALLMPLSARQGTEYEAAWSALLGEVVTADGLVRYELIAGPRRPDFDAVLHSVETFDASALGSDAEKLAFWMNAYNVKLVERVLDLGVPEDIESCGFEEFFKTPVRVAGHDLTLDQIEHVILRGEDGPANLEALAVDALDPRIHVGLNCGAVSCPRLRSQAFSAENLDTELDRAMRDFVNSPRHLRAEGDGLVFSSLLEWFGGDFGAAGKPAGEYLLGFMRPSRPNYARLQQALGGRDAAAIKGLPNVRFAYDWSLNAAR